MRVHLTESAEADLEEIADDIARSDPERARLTVRALRAAARLTSATAYHGSPVSSTAGVRKKTASPYLLLYTIIGGEVVILRIAHERSDWISLV